jgi:nucleoside-diphosphate-sugar epimerase
MMRNVLVIGGTRFFGRRLVEKLIANGDRVTVASHNFSKVSFSSEVTTLQIEREIPESLKVLREHGPYDLVYDQICYSPSAAHDLSEVLAGVTKKLIHTSTQSTYLSNGLQREEDFDPYTYPVRLGTKDKFNYGEGKRLAEAVYFQEAKFPVTAVRLPLVLGADDYSGRLDFHIQRIAKGLPIVAPAPDSLTSLISADEAASFLFWIGQQEFNGPINACSNGEMSLSAIMEQVSAVVKKTPIVRSKGEEADESPYSQNHSRHLSNAKAESLGFHFSQISDWLKPLIEERALALK